MRILLWLFAVSVLFGVPGCADRKPPSPRMNEAKPETSTPLHLGQIPVPRFVGPRDVTNQQLLIFTALPVIDDSEETLRSEDILDIKDKLAILSSNISIDIGHTACEPIFEAGTLVPVSRTNVFTTAADEQSEIKLDLCHGRSAKTRENRSIGSVRIVGVPRATAKSLRIHVRFEVRRNGDLAISAMEQDSGRELGVLYSQPGTKNEKAIDSANAAMFVDATAGEAKELVRGLRFHWCPPGEFVVNSGSTDSKHSTGIVIADGFWLAETEVTQQEFRSIMDSTPWRGQDGVVEGDKIAANHMTFTAATDFCEKLTSRERASGRLPSGWRYTLPTPSQWEYACRAGSATTFGFGDDESRLDEYAWYRKNASDIGEGYAHQVGLKKPNNWGLRDIHGNVGEMCSGWFAPSTHQANPLESREFRGGSWLQLSTACECANAQGIAPESGKSDIGFRVAAARSAN